jgi:hypothetical protein
MTKRSVKSLLSGFKKAEKPPRLKAQVDADYTHHAIQAGHKARVIVQIQREIEHHLQRLEEINAEGMRLPPEAPQPEEQKAAE